MSLDFITDFNSSELNLLTSYIFIFSESPHTFKSSFNNCFPETPLYSLSYDPSGPPCIPETIEITPED